MHMASVTTAGEILPDFYLPDLLNIHLSKVLYQDDDDLSPNGNGVDVVLLDNLLPAYQTHHYAMDRKMGKYMQ